MIVGFEDAFTNVQADFVSLCLEFAKNDVDTIYVFIYQNRGMRTFNAFFRKDGAVKTVVDYGSPDLIGRFFQIGAGDIDKLVAVCNQYEHQCPHEIKMTYDVSTKHFDAQYGYDDYASGDDMDPDEVFMAWFREERSKA